MKYLLLMYADESIGSNWSKEELQAAKETWAELRKEMSSSGVLVSSSGVAPGTSATTVRVRNDKTMITDGPFAETHEQLGGYFLVEVRGARENNLKNVSLCIPRRKITIFTGLLFGLGT